MNGQPRGNTCRLKRCTLHVVFYSAEILNCKINCRIHEGKGRVEREGRRMLNPNVSYDFISSMK